MDDTIEFWKNEWDKVTDRSELEMDSVAQSSTTVLRPSFNNLLANFPTDENGGEMPAAEVYKLIGGKVLAEYKRDPIGFSNACALRVSRALNGSGVAIPYISGETLKGADERNYFYRARNLYDWLIKSYGSPNFSTKDYSSLAGNHGIYIMQATRPADFGAWGHATLYNMTGTVGNSYAESPYMYRLYLWKF